MRRRAETGALRSLKPVSSICSSFADHLMAGSVTIEPLALACERNAIAKDRVKTKRL
jgi:hypothetical protein